MRFLKRFFKSVLATALVIGGMTMANAQTGVAPNVRFLETDQALPDGLWRIRLDGDILTIDKNTNASNNFATAINAISIAANGDVTIPQDFFVTGSTSIVVDTSIQGVLSLGDTLTTPIDILLLKGADRTTDGTRDSNAIIFSGQSFAESSLTTRDFKVSAISTSSLNWDVQTNGGGYSNIMSLTVGGGLITNGLISDTDSSIAFVVRRDGDTGDTFTILNNQTPALIRIDGIQVIDETSAEAFMVRQDSDALDVFFIDTTNDEIEIPTGALILGLGNTAAQDSLIIDGTDRVGDGQTDSGAIILTGLGFESATPHDADWKTFVDVTSNTGASTWTLQSRIDAAGFVTLLSVTDGGIVTPGTALAVGSAPAQSGSIRLSATDTIVWRDDGGEADLVVFLLDSGNNLLVGEAVATIQVETNLVVDRDASEALLVRLDGDGGDIFIVDANNDEVEILTGNLILGLGNTVAQDSITIDGTDRVGDGQTDSGAIIMTGLGFESATPHDADWKTFVDITSDAGASTWTLQTRIDAAGYANMLTVTDAGDATFPGTLSVAGILNSGPSTTQGAVIIDFTATEAFLVRIDSDGGDVFLVDTTADEIEIPTGALILGLGNTATQDSIVIDAQDRVGSGSTNSGKIVMVREFWGESPEQSDWRFYVDDLGVSNAASKWTLQERVNSNTFVPALDVSTIVPNTAGRTEMDSFLTAGVLEAFDTTVSATETLANADDPSAGTWTEAGDFTDGVSSSDYLHSSGSGSLTQSNGDLVKNGVNSRWYRFIYTVSNVTAAGNLNAQLDTPFALGSVALDVTTPGTRSVYFQTGTSIITDDFVISASSDTALDGFTFEGFQLLEITGGNVVVNGLLVGIQGGTDGIKVESDGRVILDITSTQALLIRQDADMGDVFTVNTSTPIVTTDGQFIIDDDNAEAFLVRADGDAGDIFLVDTVNDEIEISTGNFILGLGNTVAQDSITIDGTDRVGDGQTDSGAIIMTGLAFESATPHDADWKTFVAVTSDAGASTWTLQTRIDAGGFVDMLTITDAGAATFAGTLSVPGILNSGTSTTQGAVIIDLDSTEAFLVRADGDAGDIFLVDSTSDEVEIPTGNLILGLGNTVAQDSITIDGTDRVGDGQTDSGAIIMTGLAFESATPHDADWKTFVDVTSNAGLSTWTLQERVDAGGFATQLSVTSLGVVSLPTDGTVLLIGNGSGDTAIQFVGCTSFFAGISTSPQEEMIFGTGIIQADVVLAVSGTQVIHRTGADQQQAVIYQHTSTLSVAMSSGATVTLSNMIPSNSFLLGLTARVTTEVTGPSGFDIGDGSTVDRWGASIAVAVNTVANIADWTIDGTGFFPTGSDVVITTDGVDFTAGVVRITVHFYTLDPATS